MNFDTKKTQVSFNGVFFSASFFKKNIARELSVKKYAVLEVRQEHFQPADELLFVVKEIQGLWYKWVAITFKCFEEVNW